MTDLRNARVTAITAAEAAGDRVRDRLFRDLATREKGSSGDVVTDLDLTAEKTIIEILRARYPGHRIVSEEAGILGQEGPWTWLIDPLDGTNNVAVGLPILTIGITLCHEGTALASVVHDPVSRRTWSAIQGQGAWDAEGNRLVRVPGRACGAGSTSKPVLAWIQGYSVSRDDPQARALKLVLARGAHRVLDLWAPLTCWMMLARGDVDGIVGYLVGELDLHGGALIASEAGLTVRDFSGASFVPQFRGAGDTHRVIAGTTAIIKELDDMLASANRLAMRVSTAVRPEFGTGK